MDFNKALGEVICPKCEGLGYYPKEVELCEIQRSCQKCQGTGKLDWCKQAVGVAPKTLEHYKMSFTDWAQEYMCHDDKGDMLPFQKALLDKMSQQLADDIDAEILETLTGESEHNVNNKTIYGGSVYDNRVIS